MRLSPDRKTPLYNGAIECRLFEFAMVAGSNRDARCEA
jgi:putative N6-adenine-specific DNA methylase